MAAEYNYTDRTANNNKPQVDDDLYIVSPLDTPLLALLDHVPVGDTVHYTMMEDIASPTSIDAGLDEAAFGATVAGTLPRLMNVTKKGSRVVQVTETARIAEKYAITDKYHYQLQKAFLLLAKQFEAGLLWSVYSADAATSGTRSFAGLVSWLMYLGAARDAASSTASFAGNSAISSTYFSTWEDFYANGATAMSEATFNARIQAAWAVGTDIPACVGFCGGTSKRAISNFNLVYNQASASNSELTESINRTMQKEMRTRQVAMDYYESDFGKFGMVLHRDMNASHSYDSGAGGGATTTDDFEGSGDDTVVFIDPAYFDIGVFRPFQSIDLAKTDDSQKGAMVADLGLIVRNPKGGFGMSRIDGVI